MANENALRDGNRTPTLLFEDNNEIRRVSAINPLPVAIAGGNLGANTFTFQQTGPGTITLLTPAAGKRIVVKGAMITLEAATGNEVDMRFGVTNKLINKIYRGDHSGGYVEMNLQGNIDEPVVAVLVGIGGGQKAFFLLNYLEQ